MWRPEDDTLLQRLEDEALLYKLFHLQARGQGEPPHPRAAGIFAALRGCPGGAEAILAARERDDDLAPLVLALEPEDSSKLPPSLLHHSALYFASVADVLDALPDRPDLATHFRKRSLAAWLALGEEQTYLRRLASDIAGALPAEELARAAREAPLEPLDALGARAKKGAVHLDASSRIAIAILNADQMDDVCRISGCSERLAQTAHRRAKRRREAAIDAALAPLAEALREASAAGELAASGHAILARAHDVWRWAGEDEAVEQFAIEQAIPIAWDLYRAARWDDLRRLIAPLAPLVDNLATRILQDASRIAYAAGCAEMLVFRAQLESPLARQIEVAERALVVCPSHRNARLVIASYLCERATALVAKGPAKTLGLVRKHDVAVAEALVDRAERLFPPCERVADARARIVSAKRFAV